LIANQSGRQAGARDVSFDQQSSYEVMEIGDEVRLQHPLGVAYQNGVLLVADSYNKKIKRIDSRTRVATTFVGDGQPGDRDGLGSEARFREPSGMSLADGKLYVADTSNNLIRVVDLTIGRASTLVMAGA
jgi:DNA-binding beta-propeller fold protein YncE